MLYVLNLARKALDLPLQLFRVHPGRVPKVGDRRKSTNDMSIKTKPMPLLVLSENELALWNFHASPKGQTAMRLMEARRWLEEAGFSNSIEAADAAQTLDIWMRMMGHPERN